MFLPVVDHLDSMLGRTKCAIPITDCLCDVGFEPARLCQRIQRVESCRSAQLRLPAAMNELLNLGEELRFPDTAPTPLQVISRAEGLALRIVVANAKADIADFLDGPEIERPTP